MIKFFESGDWATIQGPIYIILMMWTVMVAAVAVDLWAGITCARARGEEIYSGALRRTFAKLGDYWRIQMMAFIFDLIGSCIDWYGLPWGSLIITAAIVLIEARSVLENEKSRKSNVAKLPEAVRDILNCRDVRNAEELMRKIREGYGKQ